jgi:hypothetical protein
MSPALSVLSIAIMSKVVKSKDIISIVRSIYFQFLNLIKTPDYDIDYITLLITVMVIRVVHFK